MFTLAVQKDAMVADLWNCVREEGGWSPTFLRSFNDWEMGKIPFLYPQEENLGLRTNFC